MHMTTQPVAPRPTRVSTTLREQVAEEVRVAMARRRISGSALARLMGKDQTWVSRRLRGLVAFDMDDLEAIAAVLEAQVDVELGLPHLDSNQKPTG
jgi:transcriptional regulator with XRE-family HTH domain